MEIKYYRYSGGIQFGKTIGRLLAIFCFIILLIVLTQPYFRQTYSNYDYFLLLLALLFGIIGCIFYDGLFADIGVDNDGLLVEFLWKYLRIPWSDIIDIRPFGPRFLGYWIISTNNKLTPFHRLYGFYSLQTAAPSFCINNIYKSHEYLLILISKQIKLNRRAK